jgi:pyruvate, water dikinase
MSERAVKSGIPALDQVLQGLMLGDNVVWQVDSLDDYRYFVAPFLEQALKDRRKCVYLRFAPHDAVVKPRPGLDIILLDPSPGFDVFSSQVHKIIEEQGKEAFYIFDNLSALVVDWATDELLANFFQVTCPFLYELDTVTYFALTRGRHSHSAIGRINATTQLLIEVYHANNELYIHPIKVWNRYSDQMFLPHVVTKSAITPLARSGDISAVSASTHQYPLGLNIHSIAPWESVHARLTGYLEPGREIPEQDTEFIALKQEFCRMLVGTDPNIARMADKYLSLQDLFGLRNRMIGSGRIGGKAAGMVIARAILLKEKGETDFSEYLDEHDSFYIGSDVFFTFLVNNDLFRLRLQLTRNCWISHEEFDEVEQRFSTGKFPEEIMDQFKNMLDYFGQSPIIVRSSSLLEDSFGNAFAGKYRSEFCANQGGPEERLEAFLRAVRLVYASALNPDALSYRCRRGLGDRDEQMAILVQRVSGMPYKKYFFPPLAGVAFSKNLYVWNDRIDPQQGIIRLVFGLGTSAVNRVGGDYPRMVAVSRPTLRPEVGAKIAKYSQRNADVLDLKGNQFLTLPAGEIFQDNDYPELQFFVSIFKEDFLEDPYTALIEAPAESLVLTFNNLIGRTNFVKLLGEMLEKLERVYGYPIDTEFTAFVEPGGKVRINLLQCRPMKLPGVEGAIAIPEKIAPEKILFRSGRMINGGVVKNIQYILCIEPKDYAAIEDEETKKSLGRVVGKINRHDKVAKGKIIMMGPGRWGSNDLNLGVNVSYADIDSAVALVELAREEAGHRPEVSYGTHFFQDLVEDQIIYLPVFPDDEEAEFNAKFFETAPNILAELLPDAKKFERLVKVIDVSQIKKGHSASIFADPQSQKAVCFLDKNAD